jgi:hypothetical protein
MQRGEPSRIVLRPARVEGEQRSASLNRKIPPYFIAIVRGPSWNSMLPFLTDR